MDLLLYQILVPERFSLIKRQKEDRDSDNTDDFNLEDLSSSTPSMKSTSQKAVCREKSHSPEVA